MPSWKSSANMPLGYPLPGNVDDTAQLKVGTIAKFYDETQGECEFIYLPGVAAVVLGDCVVYDLAPGAAAIVRTLSGTHANMGRSVAFASAAIVAAKFGWFQIGGIVAATVLAAFAAGARCWLTATAGALDDTTIAGCQLNRAWSSGAIGTPSATTAYLTIDRPSIQTQIT